jgi:hypothetical protein
MIWSCMPVEHLPICFETLSIYLLIGTSLTVATEGFLQMQMPGLGNEEWDREGSCRKGQRLIFNGRCGDGENSDC